jgi:hypothetical protein
MEDYSVTMLRDTNGDWFFKMTANTPLARLVLSEFEEQGHRLWLCGGGCGPSPFKPGLQDITVRTDGKAPAPKLVDSEPQASSTGEDGRSQEEAADGGKAVMEGE